MHPCSHSNSLSYVIKSNWDSSNFDDVIGFALGLLRGLCDGGDGVIPETQCNECVTLQTCVAGGGGGHWL